MRQCLILSNIVRQVTDAILVPKQRLHEPFEQQSVVFFVLQVVDDSDCVEEVKLSTNRGANSHLPCAACREDLAESHHIIARERTSERNVEQSVEVSPRSEEQMVGVPIPPQYQAQDRGSFQKRSHHESISQLTEDPDRGYSRSRE